MKNLLLALTLFATVGTAAATDGKPGKPAKKTATKMQCAKEEKGGASCCAKKATTTAAVAPAPAAVK